MSITFGDDPRFRSNTERVAHRQELKREIEATFSRFTVEELTRRFEARQVPCGRVRSTREAIAHPQVAARDILMAQQRADIGSVETLAPVVRLSRTPAEPTLPPPALGAHTKEILGDAIRS